MGRNKKVQARKYYYQNCLKHPFEHNGEIVQIKVSGVTCLIELPFPDFMSIPVPKRYYVGQLIQHWGYNAQYALLNVPLKERMQAAPLVVPEKKRKIKNRPARQLELL